MGSRFFFFTDPSLLAPQTADQAYGPAGTANGKDQFRVTDWHVPKTASSAVPAFAICDGLICAQVDDQGTLSLILKPIEQPPFDFPFISYIIYKGIDPASLVASGVIDVSKANVNQLVEAIQKSWTANGNTGDPTRECLGLHLNPVDYPIPADRPTFANAEPLDNLFVKGDPEFQLPLVRGGWRVGDFAPAGFGLEIVVDRLAQSPKISLARQRENVIAVDVLVSIISPPPDDSTSFIHWHGKEACLGHIDPCAFWGCFSAGTLRAWDETTGGFRKRSGDEIYRTILLGPHDDADADAGNFHNRNRAYVDIRNEHGQSFNYYRSYGNAIQITLDAPADLEGALQNYYGAGWPCFAVSRRDHPRGGGRHAEVSFALPTGDNAEPLVFVSTGIVQKPGPFRGRQKFIEPNPNVITGFTEPMSFWIPLYDDGAVAKTVSGYTKLCYFKRATDIGPPDDPNGGPAPPATTPPFGLVLRIPEDPHVLGDASEVRCFANDEILVDGAHVAIPLYARDAQHMYVSVLPAVTYVDGRTERVTERRARQVRLPADAPPILHQIAGRYGREVARRVVDVDGTEANEFHVYFHAGVAPSPRAPSRRDRLPIDAMPHLIVTRGEFAQLVGLLSAGRALGRTAFATFPGLPDIQRDASNVPYHSAAVTIVAVCDDNAGRVAWTSTPASFEAYAHDAR